MARVLIVGEGSSASALAGALVEEGHVVGATPKPDRGALEHVAIVCWLLSSSPERFLLGAVDSSMRGFVHQAGGWGEAVSRAASRNAIPVACVRADPADGEAWLSQARGAIARLLDPGSHAGVRYPEA